MGLGGLFLRVKGSCLLRGEGDAFVFGRDCFLAGCFAL